MSFWKILGRVPRWMAVGSIVCYQRLLSPRLGRNCRFFPSCSQYALEAIELHGLVRGGLLSLRRVGRCHPFHRGGYDPVPVEWTG